VQVLKKGVLVL